MKLWEIIINGVQYQPIKASQSWTAVMRCMRTQYKIYPKQRFARNNTVHIKCLGDA